MNEVNPGDTDYTDGKQYSIAVQLFTEDHDYYYVYSDGTNSEQRQVYTTNWPKIKNILRIMTEYSVGKELMVMIGY